MTRRVLAAVVSLAALITVPSAAPTVSRPLTVATDKGEIEGTAAHGVGRFLGIPYAAPPVGDRRWQPPAPAAGWPGVRPADRPGAHCVQTATGSGPGTSEKLPVPQRLRPRTAHGSSAAGAVLDTRWWFHERFGRPLRRLAAR